MGEGFVFLIVPNDAFASNELRNNVEDHRKILLTQKPKLGKRLNIAGDEGINDFGVER